MRLPVQKVRVRMNWFRIGRQSLITQTMKLLISRRLEWEERVTTDGMTDKSWRLSYHHRSQHSLL